MKDKKYYLLLKNKFKIEDKKLRNKKKQQTQVIKI